MRITITPDMKIKLLENEIAKLKEELEDIENNKVLLELDRYDRLMLHEQQLDQFKSTLDEINAMTNNSYATTQQKIEAIQKILAKHEND